MNGRSTNLTLLTLCLNCNRENYVFESNFVIHRILTGVQFASETLVAIQRLQKLLDLPNGKGLSNRGDTDDEVNFVSKLHRYFQIRHKPVKFVSYCNQMCTSNERIACFLCCILSHHGD